MRLSQKQEIFSEFFFAFLKSTLNFEHVKAIALEKIPLTDIPSLKTVS